MIADCLGAFYREIHSLIDVVGEILRANFYFIVNIVVNINEVYGYHIEKTKKVWYTILKFSNS